MTNNWLRSFHLHGTVDIEPRLSLEETAEKLATALHLRFTEEQTGKYEEYPAYVAEGAGFEFALLGSPAPEYDIREHKALAHQLMISSSPESGVQSGHSVEVSGFYARLIQARVGLICTALEFPATI
jgi:hypothetical protein